MLEFVGELESRQPWEAYGPEALKACVKSIRVMNELGFAREMLPEDLKKLLDELPKED